MFSYQHLLSSTIAHFIRVHLFILLHKIWISIEKPPVCVYCKKNCPIIMCVYVEGICCLSKCRRNFQVNSAVCDYIQQHVFIFIFSSRSIQVHRHQWIRVAVVTSLVHPTKSSSVTFPYILNYRYLFYFFSYNTDFDCFTKTVCKRWT